MITVNSPFTITRLCVVLCVRATGHWQQTKEPKCKLKEPQNRDIACEETEECVLNRWEETGQVIVRLQIQATVGMLTGCLHRGRAWRWLDAREQPDSAMLIRFSLGFTIAQRGIRKSNLLNWVASMWEASYYNELWWGTTLTSCMLTGYYLSQSSSYPDYCYLLHSTPEYSQPNNAGGVKAAALSVTSDY